MWYLDEKVTAEQIDFHLHSDYELLKKGKFFDSDSDVFSIENVEIFNSKC